MIEAEVTRKKLVHEVNQVVSDAEKLLKSVESTGDDKAQALRRAIEENLRSARTRLGELQANALRTGRDAARATDDYVHRKPWQSVAAAAGVGAFVGVVLGLIVSRGR